MLPVVGILDAFGHRAQPELAGHAEAGCEDRTARRIGVRAVHEAAVDFQLVEGDVAQLRERRVAGAEVIDRQPVALQAQPGQRREVEDAISEIEANRAVITFEVEPAGATITLDGANVTGFVPIGASGYSVARVPLSDGIHVLDGNETPFSVIIVGYDEYDSYGYLAGTGTKIINPDPQ